MENEENFFEKKEKKYLPNAIIRQRRDKCSVRLAIDRWLFHFIPMINNILLHEYIRKY